MTWAIVGVGLAVALLWLTFVVTEYRRLLQKRKELTNRCVDDEKSRK